MGMVGGLEEGSESETLLAFPSTSLPRGSLKWRMFALAAGLAMAGLALAIFWRQRSSLTGFSKEGVTKLVATNEKVEIPILIRDFKVSHPDFESAITGFTKNLVKDDLGQDGKPVYNGGMTVHNKTTFDQWYRDVDGINMPIEQTLVLNESSSRQFVFDKSRFFPIDNDGFKDRTQGHNFFFTLEMHHIFKYHGGEVFMFRGDDDLWVFIGGKLVIDLGGTHMAMERTVKLDELNLTVGDILPLDLFFAERHTGDSNFRIETTIYLKEIVETNPNRLDNEDRCCLIDAINFLCFDEEQWWTIWC